MPPSFDTVGIAFRISDFEREGCDVQVKNYGKATESYRYSRRLDGGGFLATGAGNSAWVEASLPKRISEDNVTPVGLDQALDVLEALHMQALEYVEVDAAASFLDAKIVRLDMVRDFHEVKDVTGILDGLAAVEQPGRVKVRRFADPARGAAETLRVGPKAWGATLYDKYRETVGRAPIGSLRFETRLHQEQLTSTFGRNSGGHLRVVEDMIGHDGQGEQRMAGLSRAWFGRAGFDRAVLAGTRLQNAVLEAEDLTAAARGGLWAYLTLPGYAQTLSAPTRRKWRRIAEGCGLTPASFDAGDRPRVLYLDYEAGRLRDAA